MRTLAILASTLFLFTANEAHAQTITGQEGRQARQTLVNNNNDRDYNEVKGNNVTYDPTKDTPDTMGAYQMALMTSGCIVRTNTKAVDDALTTQPLSRQEETRLKRAFSKGKGCGPATTSVLSLQRGMLAEASYLNLHPEQVPLPRNVDTAMVDAYRKSERDWNNDRQQSDRILIDAANCLVATNPAIADLLARTEHGSADELKVMDALFNAAPQCAGSRPTVVSRTFLRAFIMDALYRASISEVAKPIFAAGG